MPHIRIQVPLKGLFKGASSGDLPSLTSEHLNNVRPRDVLENKIRVGQRPGLDKWGAGTQIGADAQPVVFITSVSSVV